jgi:DsbC/DsbD-like thiol-disulfide interchange protein
VIRKYFVPNYQHRVTASAIALREFGGAGDGARTTLRSGALTVEIALAAAEAFAGQEIGFVAKFSLEPGWHVYGAPLPEAYTAASITFDDPKIVRQSFELPEPRLLAIPMLGETLPVYSDSFQGLGSLLLKFPIREGATTLSGHLRFQECGETVCEAPESIPFELPLTIEPFQTPTPKK